MSEFEEEQRWCHFYKLVVPSILQQKKLSIPKKFEKKIGNELHDVAILTVPDVGIWPVTLAKPDGKLCFHGGWHEFVEQCSIHAGHLLDFRYEGYSNFSVKIFDLVPYRIDRGSYSGKISEDQCGLDYVIDVDEMEDDDSVEILDGGQYVDASMDDYDSVIASSKPKCSKQNNVGESAHQHIPCQSYNLPLLRCHFNGLKTKNCTNELDKETLHQSESISESQAVVGNSANGMALAHSGEAVQEHEKKKQNYDPNEDVTTPPVISCGQRNLSVEGRQSSINVAKVFHSVNPCCMVVLRPSYIPGKGKGFFLHLPVSFSEKYLSGIPHLDIIKLENSEGKQWSVRRYGLNLCSGWSAFANENKLEEGDVCVFELMKRKDTVLKVSIFRDSKDSRIRINPLGTDN